MKQVLTWTGWISFLLLAALQFAPGGTSAQKPDHWFYTTKTLNLNEIPSQELNTFGAAGWELVGMQSVNEQNSQVLFVFKRKN